MATKLYFVKPDVARWLPTLTQHYTAVEEQRIIHFFSTEGCFQLLPDTHAIERVPLFHDSDVSTVKVNKHTFYVEPPSTSLQDEPNHKSWSQLPAPHVVEHFTRYKYVVDATHDLKVVTELPNNGDQPMVYFECAAWNDLTKKALHSFLSAMKV
jgi:hypothetical protein